MEKLIKKEPYIIAELGGNHDGHKDYIYEGIYEAKKSGADAIKLQYYNANNLILPNTPLMKNVKNSKTNDKNQYDRYKRLELNINDIPKFYKFAKKIKIDFGLSIFDHTKVKYLSKYLDFFKIASGDIEYFPLLNEISKYNKKIFVSTGLCNFKIINRAIKLLKKKDLVIMHCVCCYPTKEEDYNLASINLMKKKYGKLYDIGISDHKMIFCSRKIVRTKCGIQKYISSRSLKNYTEMLFEALTINILDDVELAYSDFIEKLIKIIDKVAPIKKSKIKNNSQEWFDGEIAEKIAIREKRYKIFN